MPLLALAQLAPSIMGLFTKRETAVKAAEAVANIASAVTGKASPDDALAVLKADPVKLLEYRAAVDAHAVQMYQEETKRLEAVNATMRAESSSGDAYVRRWRPTLGYAVAATWTTQMGALSYVIVTAPDKAAAVIGALSALSTIWGIALAVLGVAVHKRSQDKQVEAGQAPVGAFDVLGKMFRKG